jgi:hypothetical protein
MPIINIHSRHLPASVQEIAQLIASAASKNDRIWPHENWPRIFLDRPIQAGAVGGHGPIRYRISHYAPTERVRFEFTQGSQGWHELTLQATSACTCILTHTIQTKPTWPFWMAWHLMIRYMHDALIEDLFDKLEAQFQPVKHPNRWNAYVKLVRRLNGGSIQKRIA